jgi:acetoin utilization protein AcuB
MLTAQLINQNIPRLQLLDSVGKAKQLVNDFKLTHLPVVSENKFLGLISEEDLLDVEDDKIPIEVIQEHFIQASVADDIHFLNAVNCSNQFDTNIVPVVNKSMEYEGGITTSDLLKTLSSFTGATEIGGIIVLKIERIQFSLSEISRIVESNDCTILHLNTTTDSQTGLLEITLHVNKREIAAIVATFERYEYTVSYYFGNENFENEIDSNYKHLMNYLDL